jgi:hypothetical protein
MGTSCVWVVPIEVREADFLEKVLGVKTRMKSALASSEDSEAVDNRGSIGERT